MLKSVDDSEPMKAFAALGAQTVTKPIRRDVLLDALGRLFSTAAIRPAERSLAPAPISSACERPERWLLLVEDNEVIRMVVKRMLADEGFAISEAAVGKAAIEALSAARFDDVLMDVSTPVMDAIQATRALRLNEARNRQSRTPVIGLTAHAMDSDIRQFFEAGMDTCLVKPAARHDRAPARRRPRPGGPNIPQQPALDHPAAPPQLRLHWETVGSGRRWESHGGLFWRAAAPRWRRSPVPARDLT